MKFLVLILISILTTQVSFAKDPQVKKKPSKSAPAKKSKSWDDEDFKLKEDEGRDVANDQKNEKDNPSPKYWDYKED